MTAAPRHPENVADAPYCLVMAAGIENAHSVIADGHKWLNVPYDCGFAFVRDPELMHGAFQISGPVPLRCAAGLS